MVQQHAAAVKACDKLRSQIAVGRQGLQELVRV